MLVRIRGDHRHDVVRRGSCSMQHDHEGSRTMWMQRDRDMLEAVPPTCELDGPCTRIKATHPAFATRS
jgi:hypothetical protein